MQKDFKKYGMNTQGSNDKKHALCKTTIQNISFRWIMNAVYYYVL